MLYTGRAAYDMVVIGGGAAGLTAAGTSAVLGAKTAMISSGPLGGDCTWHGCVPSKTLLKAAKVAHEMRIASRYGLTPADPAHNWSQVIERVHQIRQHVYDDADAPPNMEKLGVEVLEGTARFLDSRSVKVHERTLTSRYFIIATGSTPKIPKVPGVDPATLLTNENLFELKRQPARMLVLGAGPIGVEMAQAFRRLGSDVTIVDPAPRILGRDDAELAGMLADCLRAEGVKLQLGKELANGEADAFDAILAATGRTPNLANLNLEAAGVKTGEAGISVDTHCRTNVRNIYACGDVTGKYLFTHMAEHTAKIAAMNAILHLRTSIDESRVPWCTFTDPELAHVGMGEEQLRKLGRTYRIYRFPFSKLDRAVTESATTGLIKVFADKRGRILGASILGANAGEMIAEFVLAMKAKAGLKNISAAIHPYPTFALGNRRTADIFANSVLTPARVRWIQRLFRLRGSTHGIENL